MMRWRTTAEDETPKQTSSLEQDEPDTQNNHSTSPATAAAANKTTQESVLPADHHENTKEPQSNQVEQEQKKQAQENDIHDEEDDDDDDDDGADHAEPPPTTIAWKPQNVQSTCEFTHTILDYSAKRDSGCKKAEYSATKVDQFGNRWRLIVYINGNGRASNHHLSLFLQVADADDLPFGWKKAVSYVLTLEHPSGSSSRSYAKRNPDKTFKLCPKAIDWGWSQFITSDRIQQEGFVSHDTLTVRASVTVKSSSVNIDEEDAELYLKCAVEEGNAEAVKLCLDQGASINCQFKDDLYTPLHTACSSGTSKGSMRVLNLLLEQGADGNACNKWKETPLLIAANNGHCAAVQALLKHGADPSLCSEAGWSALTFAAHKGYDDIVTLLLRARAPVNCKVAEDSSTPLHKACAGSKSGHLASVKLLLGGGADVHALNKWRETPLLTAANHGQAGAVEALLGAGADPCKCTDTGWSPLSIAAYKGHDEVVRLLLEEGAPTEEDDPTLSALLQAATKGLPDTVELLLQHGADHTVTTKKGDTALSILVEQNLIDAAVEMVTEYNASIPRCSRDRKKVQRARLLINLRMKQQEREFKNTTASTDDDETDEEEESIHAQHNPNGQSPNEKSKGNKKKKKGKGSNMSAEAKAKAAEEALLLELEQEENKAKKEEAEASSKRAKKKKKKERERQQKLKEEQERRQREEQEELERELLQKEKKEKERKVREQRLKEQQEREMREAIEREKVLAAKRKEKERREREQKQREEKSMRERAGPVSPTGSLSSTERRTKMVQTKKASSPGAGPAAVPLGHGKRSLSASDPNTAPLAGNRRWETKTKSPAPPAPQSQAGPKEQNLGLAGSGLQPVVPDQIPSLKQSSTPSDAPGSIPSTFLSPRPGGLPLNESVPCSVGFDKNLGLNGSSPLNGSGNGVRSPPVGSSLEHPAISLFRRDKVAELIQRCTIALSVVGEPTLKRVIYRWVVRAAHGQTPFVDPLIPSWTDYDQLVPYFQRQFISENRRGPSASASGSINIEALKEAGSSVAIVCQSLLKEVVQFRQTIEEQLPPDWNDAALGMTASPSSGKNGKPMVTVSWAGRSQVEIPSLTLSTLRNRYVGPADRFLASVFVAKVWYETKTLLVADTAMDFRLPSTTKECLSTEAAVSAELWSDPFTALSSSVFWGSFETVDALFGGQTPFGKDEHGGEEVLAKHGGSVAALIPFDNMVASRYVQRMLDIIESADSTKVPVSFAVFLHAECFHDLPTGPSRNDLKLLDSRLGELRSAHVKRIEVLPAGQHAFQSGDGLGSPQLCSTNSLFVLLQSEGGKSRFELSDASVSRIISSLSLNEIPRSDKPIVSPIAFPGDFSTRETPLTPHSGYFEGLTPQSFAANSPDPQRVVSTDFGTIGGPAVGFSPTNDAGHRAGPRRGRLFDLVDDGEEEQMNDVDIVSGMLNNLDMGLFQNSNAGSDIDIEAISLMGIGGPASRSLPPGSSHSGRFG